MNFEKLLINHVNTEVLTNGLRIPFGTKQSTSSAMNPGLVNEHNF